VTAATIATSAPRNLIGFPGVFVAVANGNTSVRLNCPLGEMAMAPATGPTLRG
jgi:hypothetical protein